jgi:MFS family permease
MFPLKLFRNRSFTGAQLAVLGISASFFSVFFYTTLYLQQVLGLTAVQAGLVYLPGTVISFFVAGASAQLLEKISARLMMGVGLTLVAAGMALMTLAGVESSWAVAIPGSVVALIGTGMFNPAATAVALGTVPAHQSGLAAGIHDTFRQAGMAVGIAALGTLVPAAEVFRPGGAAAYVDGMQDALWVGTAVALAGAVAAFALIRDRHLSAVAQEAEPTFAPAPAQALPQAA